MADKTYDDEDFDVDPAPLGGLGALMSRRNAAAKPAAAAAPAVSAAAPAAKAPPAKPAATPETPPPTAPAHAPAAAKTEAATAVAAPPPPIEPVPAPATQANPAPAPQDPFAGTAAAAAPAPADPFKTAAPAAVIPGNPIRESERERRANFAADLTRMDANIVTCGDMPADPEAVKKALAEPPAETRDQLLARLGFPARPRSWPIMMRWPSDRDLELLADPAVGAEQRQAYIRGLQERQRVMQRRAEQIDDYLRKHAVPAKGFGAARAARRFETVAEVDPFRGIRFATLLDEQSTASVSQMVAHWGHEVAETIDGGRVRVSKDSIVVGSVWRGVGNTPPVTSMAVQLAIREGIARGWNSFNVSGTKEFAKTFAEAARAANVGATITYRSGPFLLKKRTIHIMPAPPGMIPEPETRDNAAEDPKTAATTPTETAAPGETQARAGKEGKGQGDSARKDPAAARDLLEDEPSVSAFS